MTGKPETPSDEITRQFVDNLNRNVVAQCILDEMARRQNGIAAGPELSWKSATEDFRKRYVAAYSAKDPNGSVDDFIREFVDAWPGGMGVLQMDPEWKGELAQPPYTKDGLWPAFLHHRPK